MDTGTYRGKYRSATTRMPSWDYAANAFYFVTICTNGRAHFFGDIVNDAMKLSPIGKVAAAEWVRTTELRPYVVLDAWVIMPNHMHGIVVINNDVRETVVATRRVPTVTLIA